MIEIKFLGGAGEIGRSSFLVDTGIEKFLLDYGLNTQSMLTPIQPPTNLDAVFISHCHMDHAGLLPELYKRGYEKNSYMTQATKDLLFLLLRDSIKVQEKKGQKPFFEPHHIEKTEKNIKCQDFNEKISFAKSEVQLGDAGHIPGASTILIETGGKRILYTGDIKFEETKLMRSAKQDYKDIDILITESTYSKGNHPKRTYLSDLLREKVQETLYNDGIVLLPAFGVGRSQEMLLTVYDLGFPVYVDGICKDATRIALSNPDSVRDFEELKKAFESAYKIEKHHERNQAIKKPCIIISTSGMVTGGPVHSYIKKLYKREDCSIILVGYQVEGTPGRKLLEKKIFEINGIETDVRMNVEFLDFSAHCGREDLINFIQKINPKKIVPVHGADTDGFAKQLKEKGFDAYAPKNGETIKI